MADYDWVEEKVWQSIEENNRCPLPPLTDDHVHKTVRTYQNTDHDSQVCIGAWTEREWRGNKVCVTTQRYHYREKTPTLLDRLKRLFARRR